MKKLLIILLLILNHNMYGGGEKISNNKSLVIKQFTLSVPNPNISKQNRPSDDKMNPGIVLLVSGTAFFTAGILTERIPNGYDGPGYWPWAKQFGRAAAMTTGAVLFTSGLVYTITF